MIICLSFFWFVLNMKNLNGVAFSIVAGSAAYFLFYVVDEFVVVDDYDVDD